MKTSTLFVLILAAATALAAQAQPAPIPPPPPRIGAGSSAPPRQPVNYRIRVEWKDVKEAKDDSKFLEVLTTEGTFNLNTVQKNPVKINDNDVPVTLKFNGTLSTLNESTGRLQLFLGRTIPYITGKHGSGSDTTVSYNQMSVGLDSTFVVTFGAPQVIQTDENGTITVLVKRAE